MSPRWLRRVLFFGMLASWALAVASVGRPEACGSIWSADARLSPCCRTASQPRFTRPGGDCCDFADLETRDPAATSAGLIVPPADWVRTTAVAVLPAHERAADRSDPSIPERPPDRALSVTVLLI